MDYFILTFLLFSIIAAYFSLELKERIHAILSMGLSTISIGILLLYLNATYAGIFHLMIYTGVLTVLFATSANFFGKEENTNE